MSQTYPPPIFLTGFGQIRKLTLKRTGGDVSSPWRRHCVARHIFQAGRCGYTLRVTSQTSLIHYFKSLKNIRMFLYKRRFASRIYRIRVRVVSNIGYNLSSSTRYNTVAHALSILIFQKLHKDIVIILTYFRVTKMNSVKLL